jgi:teichuronic acid biosynthesis glycosyltransferase TuaG
MNKVTFIVLAYNQENYIEECLQSIERQTSQVYELIISDDASTDGTKNKINEFIKNSKIEKINFLNNNENRGLIKSFNSCLKIVSGDIILLQAGDDVSHPNRAEITKIRFSKTECNVLYSSYDIIDKNSVILKSKIRSSKITDPTLFIKKGSAIPPFGTAFNRFFLMKIGEINEKIKNEDDYIAMAAVVWGGLLVIPDILYKYRIHSKSISSWNNLKINKNEFLEKYLNDQLNRCENFIAWRTLIERNLIEKESFNSISNKNKFNDLIEKKIRIKKCIYNIRTMNFEERIKVLIVNYEAASLQDLIILIIGCSGILLINWARRKILKIT